MSTSKWIDRICAAAAALSLILALFLMAAARPRITAQAETGAGSGQFSPDDLDGSWNTSAATRIELDGTEAKVSGNGAYYHDGSVHIVYGGKYVVSGTLEEGNILVETDGNDGVWILLDGAVIRHSDGAAIQIEQAGKVFLTLADGTENQLISGAEYAEETISSGVDGTLYSRDDLTVNGSGSLYVEAGYKHGIVGNDDLILAGGQIRISAAEDGIHANDSVRIADLDLTVDAGDDGITVSNDEEDGYFYMESGSVRIQSCYEGIEGNEVTVAGGDVEITPVDDGINASGGEAPRIRVAGGNIRIVNETGRDADGLDSNGDILIEGGNLFVSVNGSGGNCALDCGSESGGAIRISGGRVVAAGGSMMMESPSAESEQGFLVYNAQAEAGARLAVKDAEGKVLVSEEIPCGFTNVIVSVPELKAGDLCTVAVNEVEEELTISDTYETGGRGMGGGFFGRGGFRSGGTEPPVVPAAGQPVSQDQLTASGEAEQAGQPAPPNEPGRSGWSDQSDESASEGMPVEPGRSGWSGQADESADGGMPAQQDRPARGGWREDFGTETGAGAAGTRNFRGGPQSQGQPGTDLDSPALPPEALPLLAASVVILLAGLGIALKYH